MSIPTHFEEPNQAAVRGLLHAMAGRRVLVIGDGMLDHYVYGTSSRISPEAPVQIVHVEREETLLGGAANVAKCLVALGAKVTLCCVVGDDAHGEQFIAEAKSLNIDTSLIHRCSSRLTTVKTRIVCGRQHVLRVDREARGPYPSELMSVIVDRVRSAVLQADAILLSDYDKGMLSESVCRAAIDSAGERPTLVDPKGINWRRYAGATVVKPNWFEAQAFLGTRDSSVLTLAPTSNDLEAEQMAHQLRNGLGVKNVLLTRAERGLSIACADGEGLSFPTRATTVQDEAGAGDVLAAVTCLALAAEAALPLAAWLGNVAAAAKIVKFGTHTVSDHEILEVLGEQFPKSERKILSTSQAAQLAASWRGSGKKIVFTNGCFDILHLGHTTYLEDARRLGDVLLVGINTDASVRRLKGPERPVQSEGDRARIIASQASVDAVVLFAEDTPLELIKAIKPNVLCKGADYKSKQDVVGWDVVESYGGRVALIELVEGRSSSHVIKKLKDE